jgi:fatty-acyl-CoA synthase
MSVPTVTELLLARAGDDRPGLRFEDESRSWAEHVLASARGAAGLRDALDREKPPHVGVLADNVPAFSVLLGACAFAGAVLVGLNPTRRGAALARDIRLADCQVVLAEPKYRPLLAGLDLGGIPVRDLGSWPPPGDPIEPVTASPDDLLMLIFTSGTSGDPKAVRVTHLVVLFAGATLIGRFGLDASDVCYLSMPLFHANALYAGWSVAVGTGAAMAPATFSASGLLADLRRYGATFMNYVGKPLAFVLATPERPDDRDNPLRVAVGNEASDRDIAEFSRRFDCTVWDAYGSTEGAIIIMRDDGCPPGSLGRGFPGVAVYDPDTLTECPPAIFDNSGVLTNADEAIGELVNTTGAGLFAGYYNDREATDARLRHGMFWSGDLAYRDADGWIYFAGRSADWLRVDGENMTTAPIERILQRLAPVSHAAVYAVPDEHVGDQVMAAIVLAEGANLTPGEFGDFLASQPDLSPKAWPRYVWLADRLPITATNKILKRELAARGARPEGGVLWARDTRSRVYRDT